jgi:hypothetical protein
VSVGIFLLIPNPALAADHLNLVAMVDLTQSVAVKGHDGKTEGEKNLQAVTRVLADVPTGAQVTVLGITDNSFAQPYILLSADVLRRRRILPGKADQCETPNWCALGGDEFNTYKAHPCTRTFSARCYLRTRPFSSRSDSHERKVLVIFSDMRQDTEDPNLETPAKLNVGAAPRPNREEGTHSTFWGASRCMSSERIIRCFRYIISL